jgi:zona occludens toxin
LVVLDEIWRFWDGFGPKDTDGKKRPDRVQNFFRMHRQFPHPETGVTCDLAVICQDIMDAHRGLRAVIEETYLMTKLTVIGSASRYRVDIYQRTKIRGKPSTSLQRSYNPRYFPLYASHSQKKEGGADAKEVNIDGRGNILKGVLFKVILPLMIPLFGLAVWLVWGFFHPTPKDIKPKVDAAAVSVNGQPAPTSQPKTPEVPGEWRITGWYQVNGIYRVVLSDGDRVRYLVDPPAVKQTAMTFEVQLPEGGFATEYTGGKQGGGIIPPAPDSKT